MNFSIYLDEKTGRQLERAAARSRKSRNALIREAIHGWLNRSGSSAWPEVVQKFEGVKRAVPFERHRRRLRPPARDPLA